MTTAAVFALILAAAAGLAQDLPPATRAALEERVLFQTIAEQGGRSHASGDRPELGPLHQRSVLAAAVSTLRVGITPSSFGPNASLIAEYDTAAAHNHDRVDVTATGRFEVFDLAAGAVVFAAGLGQNVTFVRTGAAIAVSGPDGAVGTFAGPLRLRSAEDASVLVVNSIRRINRLAPLVDGSFQRTPAPYRGEMEVLASTTAGKLRLVNVVNLEDYVAGVVLNESLSTFHVEALKAQAVAARGYAVANVGRFADRGFDVDDSTLSQVYRGQSSETDGALEATRVTDGIVLTREGRIVSALYSSSMGGHTEDNEYVFPTGGYPGTNADPALRGIHDSGDPLPVDLASDEGVRVFYTTIYPGANEVDPATGAPLTSLHRWIRTRTAAEVLARVKESFGAPAAAQSLSNLEITMRGASGRMMQVRLSGDWGATLVTGWSDIRRLATVSGVTPGGTGATSAPNSPSTFAINRDATGQVASVVFYGGGFGHNVGMSQYGSQGRALRGQNAFDVLQGYYRGVEFGTAPVAVGAAAGATRFTALSGRAILVIENHGLPALDVSVNGRPAPVRLGREETREVDVTTLLVAGRNEVRWLPAADASGGAAVVMLRFEGLLTDRTLARRR